MDGVENGENVGCLDGLEDGWFDGWLVGYGVAAGFFINTSPNNPPIRPKFDEYMDIDFKGNPLETAIDVSFCQRRPLSLDMNILLLLLKPNAKVSSTTESAVEYGRPYESAVVGVNTDDV